MKWLRGVLVVLGIGVLVLFTRRWLGTALSVDRMREWFSGLGAWAPLVFMLVYTVRPVVFFPASVLTIAAGLIWGPLLGTVYTVIGATGGAWLAFLLARTFGRTFVEQRLMGKFAVVDRLATENGFSVIFSLRLVPVFPYDAVSYAAGLTGVATWPFLLGTLFGALPGTVVYSYLGASLAHGRFGQIALATVLLVVLAAAPWAYKRFRRAASSKGT